MPSLYYLDYFQVPQPSQLTNLQAQMSLDHHLSYPIWFIFQVLQLLAQAWLLTQLQAQKQAFSFQPFLQQLSLVVIFWEEEVVVEQDLEQAQAKDLVSRFISHLNFLPLHLLEHCLSQQSFQVSLEEVEFVLHRRLLRNPYISQLYFQLFIIRQVLQRLMLSHCSQVP